MKTETLLGCFGVRALAAERRPRGHAEHNVRAPDVVSPLRVSDIAAKSEKRGRFSARFFMSALLDFQMKASSSFATPKIIAQVTALAVMRARTQ
jgi:hypothetical protein